MWSWSEPCAQALRGDVARTGGAQGASGGSREVPERRRAHSSLLIHQPGVAFLEQWGLLERVKATGCPPIRTWHVMMGPLKFVGTPPPSDGVTEGYAPRRFILDQILAESAQAAGAELREDYVVDELLVDIARAVGIAGRPGAGPKESNRARLVVGAEGAQSFVAKTTKPPESNVQSGRVSACYTPTSAGS